MMMNPEKLKSRFPYMFAGDNIGLSFHLGWFALFAKLCEDIDTLLGDNKRGFHWVQLKEKLGSARWYWRMDEHAPDPHADPRASEQVGMATRREQEASAADAGDTDDAPSSLRDLIADLVNQVTRETESRCIVCGQPAMLNRDQCWMLVLCEMHAK